MNRPRTSQLLALACCAFPLMALAHPGSPHHDHGTWSAWATGVLHPFMGLDHLVAMVAVGIWSAMTARRIWLAPFAFAGALLTGALLGLAGMTPPAVEPMIAASLLVLGLLIATERRLAAVAGATLSAVFALFHGVAHGTELGGPDAAAAITGMVIATMLLHGMGIGIGLAWRRTSRWPARVTGAGVALFGLALLA